MRKANSIYHRMSRKTPFLSEDFREKLLAFRHGGGFSVYGQHLILNAEHLRLFRSIGLTGPEQ